jgi:TPR repeat protein
MRNSWITTLIAIVLVVSALLPAMAGPIEDADAAWQRQDYLTAERLFRSLAEQGKASAQHRLGRMYEIGQGVPGNYVEAAKWYRLAAEQGHAGAQLYLADLYYAGEGVPRDYVQAYMWFNLGAANGAKSGVALRNALAKQMTLDQLAESDRHLVLLTYSQ